MKALKKRIFSIGLVVALVLTNVFVVSASEPQTEAVYDLKKGGTQTFMLEGKDGEVQQVVIEEVSSNARVADDTYKISFTVEGAWTAGFYVKVSSNKITSAYSPFHTALRGSITSPQLVRNSNVKVTYSFIYKWTILKYDTGVIASISNSSLKVSQK